MTSTPSNRRLAMTVSMWAGVLVLTLPRPLAASSVLLVPEAYPTIQSAIDAAAEGDTVRVGPGTYNERIDFRGKTIVVESTAGATETIIDPDGAVGSVVTMSLNAAQSPVLRGFTVRGGVSDLWAGGIYISGGAPVVEHNVVIGNAGCLGGGISVQFSAATVRNNTISGNSMPLCIGGTGGGIRIAGAGTARVLGTSSAATRPTATAAASRCLRRVSRPLPGTSSAATSPRAGSAAVSPSITDRTR